MRVLVLSYWYQPEPVTKPHDLACELVRRGHEVTVLTGFPNYPTGDLFPGYHRRLKQVEHIDGVRVVRLPVLIDRSKSGKRRALSYFSYALLAPILGAFECRKVDAIWTYQIGLPGVFLSKLTGAPLIHEVQDLWPEWSVSGGLSMGSRLYRVLDRVERAIYRRARAITTISHGFKQALIAKGVPADKITIVPNWANDAYFQPVERDSALAAEEGLAGRFNVIYGGNIGTAQALGVVLDAASQLSDLEDVQFVLIGDGMERVRLAAEASSRGLDNVRFLGARAPERMASYLAWASALLLTLKPCPEYELTIPSKTYAYLAVGRPILAAASGEVAMLVKELDAGVVCAPGNPSALAQAVRGLHALPGTAREAMGERGRQGFLKRFTRKVLVDEYEELLDSVVRASD